MQWWAGANQLVHRFLVGKGLGIQQETSVCVGSPKFAPVEHWKLKKEGERIFSPNSNNIFKNKVTYD